MPAAVTSFQEQVRGTLTQQIAQSGHATSNNELALLLDCTRKEIEEALLALHNSHSLLLHANKTEPWVVHPFSLYPSSCWVQVDDRGYWATCLYCDMGIAAALRADADMFTRFEGEIEQCIWQVRDQDVLEKDLVFHLSTPIKEWWDNVIYACGSFQPFRNEEDVDDWCRRQRMKKGAVVPLPQMWRFASAWYGEYVAKPWHKRSKEEIQQVLKDHGLVGAFWSID